MIADISTLFSAIILIIAFSTFMLAIRQMGLVRRTLYGEIYEKPPLERVGFLDLEIKRDNRVRFAEVVEENIFEKVILPRNSKVPLLITWRTIEKQSLRHAQFGFELGYKVKPRVVRRLKGWVAKEIKPLRMVEYIDLDGYYHIEYHTPRKFGRKSPFIVEFEIETGNAKTYDFRLEVYSEEAKESFKKSLKVVVE